VILPSGVLDHVKDHEKPMSQALQCCYLNDASSLSWPQAFTHPGLAVVSGVCCTECDYCSPFSWTLPNHWSSKHPDNHEPFALSYHEAPVQCFFHVNHSFFNVQLPPKTPEHALFELYDDQIASKFLHQDENILAPSVNEIPPLLRLACWNQQLSMSTHDPPHLKEVLNYMTHIRRLALEQPLGTCILLTQFPRSFFFVIIMLICPIDISHVLRSLENNKPCNPHNNY